MQYRVHTHSKTKKFCQYLYSSILCNLSTCFDVNYFSLSMNKNTQCLWKLTRKKSIRVCFCRFFVLSSSATFVYFSLAKTLVLICAYLLRIGFYPHYPELSMLQKGLLHISFAFNILQIWTLFNRCRQQPVVRVLSEFVRKL